MRITAVVVPPSNRKSCKHILLHATDFFFCKIRMVCIIPFIDRRESRFFCGYPKDVHNENGAFRVTDENMRGGYSAPPEDDQVTGIILSSPLTPSRAQRMAASLMVLSRCELDGCKPSKMAAFLCFQMNQAVMITREAKPLRC